MPKLQLSGAQSLEWELFRKLSLLDKYAVYDFSESEFLGERKSCNEEIAAIEEKALRLGIDKQTLHANVILALADDSQAQDDVMRELYDPS